jgi:hypothetical protein
LVGAVTFLRPNVATISRKVATGQDPTGEQIFSIVTVQSGVPCLIDALDVSSRMGGDLQLQIEGVVYIQTHVMFVDGLMPAAFAGVAPGGSVAVNSVTYVVAPNGQGAFVDAQVGDSVTDESGTPYLVLARAVYYGVNPSLQLRLQRGRSWLS